MTSTKEIEDEISRHLHNELENITKEYFNFL